MPKAQIDRYRHFMGIVIYVYAYIKMRIYERRMKMGDVSIIARRLRDGHVQYGWSGNGGYCRIVGQRLLAWYDTPELVEYLFGLGELMFIGKPGSEKENMGFSYTHALTGRPHYLGTSEKEIFSKIAFISYGYFYDLDNRWYYIIPGPFRIKIPLELVCNNMNDDGYEFEFCKKVKNLLMHYILEEYGKQDERFQTLLNYTINDEQRTNLLNDENPFYVFSHDYYMIYSYFDNWVVAIAHATCESIVGFKMSPKVDDIKERKETFEW